MTCKIAQIKKIAASIAKNRKILLASLKLVENGMKPIKTTKAKRKNKSRKRLFTLLRAYPIKYDALGARAGSGIPFEHTFESPGRGPNRTYVR